MKQERIAIWAVNPFETSTKPTASQLATLSQWLTPRGIRLLPVYMLHAPTVDLSAEMRQDWMRRYLPAMEAELERYLKDFGIPGVLAGKVLIDRSGAPSSAAAALLQYADDLGALCIVTSSKGMSGAKRAVLGSFAESLLVSSEVPVWVFGDQGGSAPGLNKILFPTDFSEHSREAFDALLGTAKVLGASVDIFFNVCVPASLLMTSVAMGEEYFQEQEAWARKEAARWMEATRDLGVRVGFLCTKGLVPAEQAIREAARDSGASLIAMASQSGLLSAVVLGSVARQLVRSSDLPVLVFGPQWQRSPEVGQLLAEEKRGAR